MGAIRLAKFNIDEETTTSAYFTGLPTPINALSIGSLVLFIEHIKSVNPEYSQPRLLLPVVLSLSFLMVSKVKFAKFPLLNFRSGSVNSFRLIGILVFIASFIASIFFDLQYRVLIGFVSFYIILGLFKHFLVQEELTS
jgi:CDP-diacylglycerol--serine O-phosphatidyltransferase